MGNNDSKQEKQLVLKEEDLKIKSRYLAGILEQKLDKEVNLLIKTERNLLGKYSEERRTVEDLLFKDEVRPSNAAANDPDNGEQDPG